MKLGRLLRILAAIAMLIAALVHLHLYYSEGYRGAGDTPNFGRSIFLTAVAFAVVAVLVLAMPNFIVRLLAILLSLATVIGFAVAHTGHDVMGFSTNDFGPNPDAGIALVVELFAAVVLA